jgi:glycerol-3-phosphate dehydrogenase
VNSTGPFSDPVRFLANPDLSPRLALSRGVHILLPLNSHAQRAALLIPKTEDGRVLFAIPWLGRLLVGTTDDEVSTVDPSPVSRAEADYLIRHLNRYVTPPRRVDEIVSAFSGVRPLVRSPRTHDTKKLIRDHEVELDACSGLISVLGGKWTTYRAMAEDAIDLVQQRLGQQIRPSPTAHHPLAGAFNYTPDYWKALADSHSLNECTARHLAQKYGSRAPEVLALADQAPHLRQPIVPDAAPLLAEIVFSIRHEMAMTIEDVLARRIGLQYFSWTLAAQAAPVVADHLAHELSWTGDHQTAAIREYRAQIARMQTALASPSAHQSS